MKEKHWSCHICGGHRWKSVKEELPNDELVLIYIPTLDENKPLIQTAWHSKDDGWSLLIPYWLDKITHWMPLPDPPEKE